MKLDDVLKDIAETAKHTFLPIIGPEKGKVLIDVVKENKPKNILEVGTLVGYSAILMSQYLPKSCCSVRKSNRGAGDGDRTHALDIGNVAFYH